MNQNESNDSKLEALTKLSELSEAFNASMQKVENESETFWNSLSYDEKLKVFCAVSRRIFDGEIKQKGSYRYVLYDVFGFEADAYVAAQCAGYMAIHNAIFDGERIGDLIKEFCEKHMDITNDNLQEQIDKYLIKKHL